LPYLLMPAGMAMAFHGIALGKHIETQALKAQFLLILVPQTTAMGYTIHRKVKVLSVERRQETHLLRQREIVDPVRIKDPYMVTVARFSDVSHEATIADFKGDIAVGQTVSVAIDDKDQLIAVINHSTGEERSLKENSLTFAEIASAVFYVSIPSVLLFFIARKAFQTEKYHQMGWVLIAVGIAIILLVARGITRQFTESSSALTKLKDHL
jgi:hypothetical protein